MNIFSRLWISDLLNLFFPNCCQACGNTLVGQEQVICSDCLVHLPRTGFHLHLENPVSRIFWGRVNLESASSFLFFTKGGKVQHLIHSLKYKGKQETGVLLGELYGVDLKNSPYFSNVEVIVPVPMHAKKIRTRGYNQCEKIATGLSQSLNVPVIFGNLIKLKHTESQTTKTRQERWDNVKDVFGVNDPQTMCDKHILLVDDVLTTGATLEACASKILQIPGTRVSVVTLAYAQA